MELPPLRDLGGINPFTPPEYATVYIYIYIYIHHSRKKVGILATGCRRLGVKNGANRQKK